jgi:hypothetical protein
VAEVIEHLPGKHKGLSSNPTTAKKEKKDNNILTELFWGLK